MSSIFRVIFSLARVLSLEGLCEIWILKDVESQKVQFSFELIAFFFGFVICHPKKPETPTKFQHELFPGAADENSRNEMESWPLRKTEVLRENLRIQKLEFISYLVDGFSPQKHGEWASFPSWRPKIDDFFAIWRVKHQIIVPGQARMLKCCRFGVIFVIQMRCLDWATVSRCHNTEWPLKKLEILASKYMPHAVHTISIASYGSIDMMYIYIHIYMMNITKQIYTSIAYCKYTYTYILTYIYIYLYNTHVATNNTAAKCASPEVST